MSLDVHPIRHLWFPLQHMAIVKIVETLWRNLEDKEDLKNSCIRGFYKTFLETHPWDGLSEKVIISSIIEKLEIAVNKLPLPEKEKRIVERYMRYMVRDASNWLHTTEVLNAALRVPGCPIIFGNSSTNIPPEFKDHWTHVFRHFVDNMKWKSTGCLDDRSMLASYVSNCETISFEIWKQLCDYCIEDDIIKFARTINWENCKKSFSRDSPYSIYWYNQIYDKFPAPEMFDGWDYSVFEENDDKEHYRKENFWNFALSSLRHGLRFTMNTKVHNSTVSYSLKQLGNDEQINRFISQRTFYQAPTEVQVHLLRRMEKDTFLEYVKENYDALYPLMAWPWILFVDDWIELFEIVPVRGLQNFFSSMGTRYLLPNARYHRVPTYELFQKLWGICYKRFGSCDAVIKKVFISVFQKEDVNLCRIVFAGIESRHRDSLIWIVKNKLLMPKFTRCDCRLVGFCEEFIHQFGQQFLRDDERQGFFGLVERFKNTARMNRDRSFKQQCICNSENSKTFGLGSRTPSSKCCPI